jgi:molybdenum cofactor synthesis domain-containing protein
VIAFATQHLHASLMYSNCLPDERTQISRQLLNWASNPQYPDLILTTGGTGFSPRDVTPEATHAVIERHANNLMELARMRCCQKTPLAYLSRGVAGILYKTLVVNLPGSERGALETLEAVADVLPHALGVLRGNQSPHEIPLSRQRS